MVRDAEDSSDARLDLTGSICKLIRRPESDNQLNMEMSHNTSHFGRDISRRLGSKAFA